MTSPNHNDRRPPFDTDGVRFVVLHYTGMESGKAARERLCDANAGVSAHYLVWEDGRTESLVPEDRRAWHAGVGEWQGVTDLNSASIGIEIVNGGHDHPGDGTLPPFTEAQIRAVIRLLKTILARHDLPPSAVIGHSDLAPARKQDPGEHFPWQRLAEQGVSIWPRADDPDTRILFNAGDRDRGVSLTQLALAELGYGVEVNGVIDEATRLVVAAFQRRFRPERVDGLVDVQTLARLGGLTGASSAS